MRIPLIVSFFSFGLLSGCTTMPDVTVYYFFPRAQTQLQIAQSLVCNADRSQILSVATVTPNTIYSSDRSQQGALHYQALSSAFADADIAVNLTEDGRLSGINAMSAGQGDAIFKNTLAFAVTAAGGFKLFGGHIKGTNFDEACTAISSFSGGPGKPVTVIYRAAVSYASTNDTQPESINSFGEFEVDPGSSALVAKLKESFPKLLYKFSVTAETPVIGSPVYRDKKGAIPLVDAKNLGEAPKSPDEVLVTLNKYAMAKVEVTGPDSSFEIEKTLWTGVIPVPIKLYYVLPIPKAVLFGKQSFGLALSGYGSVQKLQYATTSGGGDAADAATALAKALKGPSAADQAAALKAEADMIAQQQRLLVCKAKSEDCK